MAEKRLLIKKIGYIFMALIIVYVAFMGWRYYGGIKTGVNLEHRALKEKDVPVYLGEIPLPDNKKPAWVYVYETKLYVDYFDEEKIDLFSLTGKKQGEFRAKAAKGMGAPQGIIKTSRGLMVADFHNGAIGFFADSGRLLDAYYETAEKRQIQPVSAAVYGEVFYITDISINGWMTVFEDGEMIMEVKGDDEEKKLEFPYGIVVTSDGRVIVTDPAGGRVKAFNCAGWYAYDLPTEQVGMKNPQGIAIDGLGRIHIVDNGVGKVFVYDNVGRFMFTYGKNLKNPSTLAVTLKDRVIYIANTEKSSISVWGY